MYIQRAAGSAEQIIQGYAGTSNNVSIRADGGADFGGTDFSRNDTQGFNLAQGFGACSVGIQANSGSGNLSALSVFNGNNESVRLNYDGSGTFNGKLTSATTISSDSGSTLATKSYVDANGGGASAWVTFRGTQRKSNPSENPVVNEEVPIGASSNVSSVVYNGTGSYTVNFTNPMSTAEYAVSGSATRNGTGGAVPRIMAPATVDTCTTSSIQIYTADDTGNYENCAKVSVVIHA